MRYEDWIDKEQRDMDFARRQEARDLHYCGGCGKPYSEHIAPEELCHKYEELMDAVVGWRQGDVHFKDRLRMLATREIMRRLEKETPKT